MESLVTTINAGIAAALSATAPVGGTVSFPFSLPTYLAGTLTSGTGQDKANQLLVKQYTLGPAETVNVNLYNGAVNGLASPTDNLGNALTIATIKKLLLQILGNTGNGIVTAATVHSGGGGSGYTNGAQTLTVLGGNYLGSVVIHSGGGGSSYAIGDVLTIAGGTGTAATVQVLTVSAGAILTLAVLTRGSYSTNPTTSANGATGGSGSGASLDLTIIASSAATVLVNVAANAVATVTSVSTPGSYVALPAASACPTSGGGGTGATLDLTLGTASGASVVYNESDFLTVGGVGGTSGWTSVLSPNTATALVKSGTANLPGTLDISEGGTTGWVVGSGATNNILKIVNNGSNPVAFLLVVVGATA